MVDRCQCTQTAAMLNGKMLDGQVCPFNNETEIKNPEIDPHRYAQLIFDKGTEAVQQRKEPFHLMVLDQLHSQRQKINLYLNLTPCNNYLKMDHRSKCKT